MAYWEYQQAGWKNSGVFKDYIISLAWRKIHTHKTLERTKNTAYAYEGIIYAYTIAKEQKDVRAISELSNTIDQGLYKLTTWQVEGPLQSKNEFLSSNKPYKPIYIGGIMNHSSDPSLRIDVVQHQMHAIILALKYVYN